MITTTSFLVCSGYMAPEYVMHRQFSFKSDIFSFGVLILEIVSGQRSSNNCFGHDEQVEYLLTYVSTNIYLLYIALCFCLKYYKSINGYKIVYSLICTCVFHNFVGMEKLDEGDCFKCYRSVNKTCFWTRNN